MKKPKRRAAKSRALNNFSKNLRLTRKKRGLTQSELAAAAQVDFRHLQQIETKPPAVRICTAESFAKALKVPLVDLLLDPEASFRYRIDCMKAMLETHALPCAITDVTGLIVYCNRAYEQMVGYSSDEIVDIRYGKDFLSMPGERLGLQAIWEKYIAERIDPEPYATNLKRKDGTLVSVVLLGSLFVDGLDRVVGSFCLFVDQTRA